MASNCSLLSEDFYVANNDGVLGDVKRLEDQLNSFDPTERAEALCDLTEEVARGSISIPPTRDEVNLHYHTFFSFNAEGWSPSRIAWEARKYGLAAAGIVDFDVLDGMEEFLAAGEIIDLPTTAAMETRVFIDEYSRDVINSPNEPGISYFMAAGCYKNPDSGTKAAETLQLMRDLATRRNLGVMERVNNYLDQVRLDYDTDVLPLTPSGNATERHLLAAYDAKSREVFGGDAGALASFWAKALGISVDEAAVLLTDTPKFHEKMRGKLMKFGGVGYVTPTPDTFPTVELVIEMAREMEALPTATWLDGTNPGESDMPRMLALLESKGVIAMNIVPDRNWNIKYPDEKRVKVENLGKAVAAAKQIDFPLCVGTEMNKGGLPFVDNFAAPELAPFVEDFIEGAYFFWGHTFLARNAGIGFASEWARHHFGDDRAKKNQFYAKVGRLIRPSDCMLLGGRLRSAPPGDILRALQG